MYKDSYSNHFKISTQMGDNSFETFYMKCEVWNKFVPSKRAMKCWPNWWKQWVTQLTLILFYKDNYCQLTRYSPSFFQ